MATEPTAKPAPKQKAKTKSGLYVNLSPEHRSTLEQMAKEDMRSGGAGEMLSVLIARSFTELTAK
jgi:hypothetical protein